MLKVYNAIYRIDDIIYAEGYIVMYDDKNIEGIFALDYIYIYAYDKNLICFLKALSHYSQNNVIMQESKTYEFYSSNQVFRPFEKYFFFNNSDNVLSLEIKNEVLDIEYIKIILMDIARIRA